MGVVRDVTVDNLVTAVGNIDTSSLAQDSTLQDVVTAIGNISGGNDPVTNTTVNTLCKDTTGQSIASAISGLGATLGSDRALIDGSNIANPSAFRQNIGVNKIIVGGILSALALTNGNIRLSIPVIKGYNNISCDKVNNITMDIYGNISSTRVSASLNPRMITNIVILDFTPNVTLSNYTTPARVFCVDCEAIEITLS